MKCGIGGIRQIQREERYVRSNGACMVANWRRQQLLLVEI